MGILARQGFINTIIIYAGFGLGYINVAILMPKLMSANEMGARETIVSYAMILAQFGMFGLPNSLTKFFSKYKRLIKFGLLEYFITAVILIYCLVAGLFYFVSPYFTQSLEELSPITFKHINLVYTLSFLMVINFVLEAFFRNLLLSYIPTFLKEFLLRLVTTLLITTYAFDILDFTQFLIGFVYSYGIITFVLLVLLASRKTVRFSLPRKTLDIIDKKEVLHYALFTFIISAASMIVIQIDKIMLSSAINEYSTGVYTLAVYLATLIETPKRAIVQTSSPLLADAWSKNDTSQVRNILRVTSSGQQLIGSLLFILLWSSIDSVYQIIPKENTFSAGKWVVLFIGLTKVISMSFGATSEALAFSSKYRSNLYFSIAIVLLTIITNLSLIPIYGITGAAIASMLTITIVFIAKGIFIINKFKISCFSSSNIIILLISIITFVIGYHLPTLSNPYVSIIYKSAIIVLAFLPLLFFSKASPEFNGAVHKYLLKKK